VSEIVEALIIAAARELRQARRWWIVPHRTCRAVHAVLETPS